MAERTNKKVSRACNTCRLKRKKCNGLDPCLFCTETQAECSYSREPRRRGPPSGYLRYTETRVNLLETLLGLFIVSFTTSTTNVADTLLDSVHTLCTESKTCTQDVWDAHKTNWTASEAAKVLDSLVISFAPFVHRTDQETTSKPLLPPFHSNKNPTHSKGASPSSTASPTLENPNSVNQSQQSSTSAAPLSPASLIFPLQPSYMLPRESFERTQSPSTSVSCPRSLDLPAQKPSLNSQPAERQWPFTPRPEEIPDFSEGFTSPGSDYADSARGIYSVPAQGSSSHAVRIGVDYDMHMLDMEAHSTSIMLPQDLLASNGYTGSYWRTADLGRAETFSSPSGVIPVITLPSTQEVDLPPPHIVSYHLDIYFQHVHPSFPFLSPRSSIDALLSGSESFSPSEGTTGLLLALCAYSGRLSPSIDASNNGGFRFGGAGDARKVAADLWYEQARTVMNASLRKGRKLETVQTLLLLALRDHGKGNEGQAWLLVGLAVRMGQDLGLHHDLSSSPPINAKYTLDERRIRRNVWGVVLILDLFLSLQLGRPSAIVGGLRVPISSSQSNSDLNSSLSFGIPTEPQPLFIHTVSLCQIISRVNFYLYLGFGHSDPQSQSDKLTMLQGELDQWHHALPLQFRISIGHQPEREVLEVNMLYHVAIILLYRPFSKGNTTYRVAEIFLDAASTFNVLLEKYRTQYQTQASHPIQFSLAQANPNMIYLIFTVAITHLSGFKLRQRQQQREAQRENMNRATAVTLQTQLHLLNCLEALTAIGETWESARLCWRTLDKLMEVEGMKPKSVSGMAVGGGPRGGGSIGELGKRKRDEEETGKTLGGEDRRVNGSGSGGQRCREQDSVVTANITPMHDFALAPRSASLPQSGGGPPTEGSAAFSLQHPLNSTPLGWNSHPNNPNSSSTLNPSLPPLIPAADTFDPVLFPFAKWLPERDSTGLGSVWDGDSEWDEGLWSRSMGLSFGEYEGVGNG